MRHSINLKEACYSTSTSSYLIALFVIEDDSLEKPILISTDATQRIDALSTDREIIYGTVFKGETYLYFPMEWELPDDSKDAVPSLTISISNVGGEMTKIIREIQYSPKVTMHLALSTELDRAESTMTGLQMSSVKTDELTVTGDLTLDLLLDEGFPTHTFTPSTAKGLFQA